VDIRQQDYRSRQELNSTALQAARFTRPCSNSKATSFEVAFLHSDSDGEQPGVWHDDDAGISTQAQTDDTTPVADLILCLKTHLTVMQILSQRGITCGLIPTSIAL
jgi:hypothetical protein